jgi:acyl carrier protein
MTTQFAVESGGAMSGAPPIAREHVAALVKRSLIQESGQSFSSDQLTGNELLNGRVLRVASMGLLGILIRLEDELDITLPDNLFAGRTFRVVDDVVEVVFEAVQAQPGGV